MEKQIENLIVWIEKNEKQVSSFLGVVIVTAVFVIGFQVYFKDKLAFSETPEVEMNLAGEDEESDAVRHVVARGEGLSGIAEMYYGDKESWTKIAEENGVVDPNLIEVGQILVIPNVVDEDEKAKIDSPTLSIEGEVPEMYVVKQGEYLSQIAKNIYGDMDRWVDILEANKDKIQNPEILEAGLVLTLPR